ncbi:MAG: ribosome-associated translation inhibitor RaiA [Nitrospirota bacterium]|nr:ribosome-associated translation inhibitor RaiA [Nitrospirota bacterium]MDE3242909.1 ribosome-associated translation inhibitor RaiA [Nitrospirota bacterium]
MQILITGRHVEVTPALRRYIEVRMKRVERFEAKLGDVQVILGVEKYRHTAEVILTLNGVAVQAKASTKEMYASIDEVLDKIGRQISRQKDKRRSRKAAPAALLPLAPRATRPSPRSLGVRLVRTALRQLTLEEAIERLDAQAGAWLVFQDAASERLQVLHRSAGGAIELIDPSPSIP